MNHRMVRLCMVFPVIGVFISARPAEAIVADSTPSVVIEQDAHKIVLDWPLGEGDERGRVVLSRAADKPLIQELAIQVDRAAGFRPLLTNMDPALYLVVGERRAGKNRPPGMSEFNEFFDAPANRPHQAFRSRLESRDVRLLTSGSRASVGVGTLIAGSFSGQWQLTVHAGSRLLQLEAAIKTEEPHRAYLYDLALESDGPPAPRFVWKDTDGELKNAISSAQDKDRPLAVRHRTIIAETPQGSVACFPPPHQYFFPRDLTDNQSTVWYGTNHRGLDAQFGFGIRQTERGGGGYVPWFNAPPGSEQRLGAFFLLTAGDGQKALNETLRFTHHDQFVKIPGYRTLTSHFHMAIAMAALERRSRGLPAGSPDFVRMFKDMGVEMVHLAEFHGDGHPQDPGPLRLAEMKSMFDECKRLSDDQLLMIPGEEANVHLGISRPGQEAGHWICLFPRPVYWTMQRASGKPFVEVNPSFGQVYHVGDAREMLDLVEREDGLAWTAHARIKASSWAPDAYRNEPYYLSEHWLGAAWKAMPADLSDDRLGRRALDLLDDMANWGQRKYVLGEVDVFKLDHTHELYGHMNINYVAMDRVPRFEEGWKPLLERLRGGRFFVTTGEIVIPEFQVNDARSGQTVSLIDGKAVIQARLQWTFPLRFAELISGDGARIHRQRIDLSDTQAFGERVLTIGSELPGRTWVRFEVWDIAGNGAFTQPVWLKPAG